MAQEIRKPLPTLAESTELWQDEMLKIQSKSTTIQNNMYNKAVEQAYHFAAESKKAKDANVLLRTQLQVAQKEIKALKDKSSKSNKPVPMKTLSDEELKKIQDAKKPSQK